MNRQCAKLWEFRRLQLQSRIHRCKRKVLKILLDRFTEVCSLHRHRLCPHVRNVSDECLDLLKANDGIIMISLIPDLTYVDASKANVHHVVDHILYAAKRIGYDHVGIGSDFDGMEKSVEGVEDISLLSNLVAALLMRGVQRHQIEQILGLNVIRVLEAVEKVAKDLSRELAVLEDPIKQLWGDSIREYVRSVYTNCEE